MGSIDLSGALVSALTAIPIWTFVGFAVKYWTEKSKEAAKEFKEDIHLQFREIKEDMKKAHFSFADAIQRIELKLEGAGVSELKKNLEILKEASVRTDMKLEAAFRNIDELKAAR